MTGEIVYLSAPCDLRGCRSAVIPWHAMRLFQPLLGQDAQMAAFASGALAEGIEPRVLAAPEIYGSGAAMDQLRPASGERILAHVRFGSPRLPRLLKHVPNAVALAEDTTIPIRLGRNPFAAGAALPAKVSAVLLYDPLTPVPQRMGASPAPTMMLPADLMTADLPTRPSASFTKTILQPCVDYQSSSWRRWSVPAPSEEVAGRLAQRPVVLLPWNLAAPGGLVPDLLQKVSTLADQDRFPLTAVVLPYNDAPDSLIRLDELAASCAARSDRAAILLARAGSIDDSLALVRLCRRAWIDTADPEWRWTLRRLGAIGLPANFVSDVPAELAGTHDPGPLAADALITHQSHGRAGLLFWRHRGLSLRRLARLAHAVALGADTPFQPSPPLPAPDRPTLQELLQWGG